MKVYLFLNGCLIYQTVVFVCTAYESEVKLTSVTSFEELEEIYLRTKVNLSRANSKSTTAEPQEKLKNPIISNTSIRKDICKHIFRSQYFQTKNEEIVDVDDSDIRHLLKSKYPGIFEKTYKKSKYWPTRKRRRVCCKYCFSDSNRIVFKYEYKNDPELLNVADSGKFNVLDENVFRCLVRNRQRPEEIREYFVSGEDNVNFADKEEYKAARFIFTIDSENLLVLNALAETPALTFTRGPKNLERLYLFIKQIYDSKPKPDGEDPFCRLMTYEKLRICSSILNSLQYKDELEFIPSQKNVSSYCVKKEISFQTTNPTIKYEEWMIMCTGIIIGSDDGRTKPIFLSRGYSNSKVFVYKEFQRSIYLDNFSGHVPVSDDDNIL